MLYLSTRGEAPPVTFSEALLAGLARDGGLYVPETWPNLAPSTLAGLAGRPYQEVAAAVLRPFLGGTIPDAALRRMIDDSYAGFDHGAIAPLVELSPNEWILELFHGPTLAFKDIAMQLLARLMDHALGERSERATIIGATSGDTGGAAVEAFRGRDRVDLIILYPEGRISEVQRRMMTTAPEENVHAVAIAGTFDDCQAIVKALFNDHGFRDRVRLSSVNSINWARIAAQTVYYVTTALALGAPGRKLCFAVPTGNFGDVFAGYVAARMGLPIERLIVATNVNDILARTLQTGRYEVHDVVATSSPAMDIQVSSNFERLLFEAYRRDAASVRATMGSLAQSGRFEIAAGALAEMRTRFAAGSADEKETVAAIRAVHEESNYILDPHTAVGLAVARKLKPKSAMPTIMLGTAHPAKFPDAVAAAIGVRPELPARLADLGARRERIVTLPASSEAVARFVEGKSRAAVAGAAA